MQKCAEAMCDKHIVKMPLEYAQILSTVCRINGLDVGYKATHRNHPCVIWAAASQDNFRYLTHLAFHVCGEYTKRYISRHKSGELIATQIPMADEMPLPDIGLTPFPQCMPEQYKQADAVEAYRAYYRGEKTKFATWKNRNAPDWWNPAPKPPCRTCGGDCAKPQLCHNFNPDWTPTRAPDAYIYPTK